jgi:hypothetical protein
VLKNKMTKLAAVGVLGVAMIFVGVGSSGAQARLEIGGSQSNFGTGNLRGGFMPDPFTVNIRSGGSLNVRNMSLGSGCAGFATARPDYILNYSNSASFLRFFFRPNNQSGPRERRDTTLVINDANGDWHCNDDGGGNFNPMVDISNPPSGQYDIWVGTYDGSGQFVDGRLGITELRSERP